MKIIKICTNAGHGGNDSGAIGSKLLEKDVNLKVVLYLNKLLVNYQNKDLTK